MKKRTLKARTLILLAVILPLLGLFFYVGLQSGPLAPVAVTVITVQSKPISPALFGIGTVQAENIYKIGPTSAARVKSLEVQVGDHVLAGQLLAQMDPVDLDDRIRAQESTLKRTQSLIQEAISRHAFAKTQAKRYEQLWAAQTISQEALAAKQQEYLSSQALLAAAHEDYARAQADLDGLITQKNHLNLVAPTDGLISAREADPGTTVVAGQTVVELYNPKMLWVDVRFDQINATGLAPEQTAHIQLRTRAGLSTMGRVLRIEPKADAVTEEIMAKVVFDARPDPAPPVGELAEVTVELQELEPAPVIPNAAIRREGNVAGVWLLQDGKLKFSPITLGANDLNGQVQILKGLNEGDQLVVYSEKSLTARSRIQVAAQLNGAS